MRRKWSKRWIFVVPRGVTAEVLSYYAEALLSEEDELIYITDGPRLPKAQRPITYAEVPLKTAKIQGHWLSGGAAVIFEDPEASDLDMLKIELAKSTYGTVMPNGVFLSGPMSPLSIGPIRICRTLLPEIWWWTGHADLVVIPIVADKEGSRVVGELAQDVRDTIQGVESILKTLLEYHGLGAGSALLLPPSENFPIALAFVDQDDRVRVAADLFACVRSEGYQRVLVFPPALDGVDYLDSRYSLIF